MKKYSIFFIIILLLLGGFAIWYYGYSEKSKPVILETVKPQFGFISINITATGKIEPVDTVTIGSQVSGTIKSIFVDFNDRVRKGQLIAELDKSLYLSSVNQYSANLEYSRSNLSFQENNFLRQKQLYESQVISRSEFENARYQFESAKANLNSVQAQLDGAQKNLSYTNIYSPVNGVVLFRNISIGQTVAASFNTPTLFVIAKDITKMQVQASVDEADIGNVKKGQWAIFTVDAFPDISFSGLVREIRLQPAVSANVVTYTTIIDAPNHDLKLKPGMTANIFIYTKFDSNAMLIPSRALRFQPDSTMNKQFTILKANSKLFDKTETAIALLPVNPFRTNNHMDTSEEIIPQAGRVWIKSGDSLIEKKIWTGINDDTHVQVLNGLSGIELVVIGVSVNSIKTAAEPAQKSPFMPSRRPATPSPKTKAANR